MEHYVLSILIRRLVLLLVACVKSLNALHSVLRGTTLRRQREVILTGGSTNIRSSVVRFNTDTVSKGHLMHFATLYTHTTNT